MNQYGQTVSFVIAMSLEKQTGELRGRLPEDCSIAERCGLSLRRVDECRIDDGRSCFGGNEAEVILSRPCRDPYLTIAQVECDA
jgi:hypothetical protein